MAWQILKLRRSLPHILNKYSVVRALSEDCPPPPAPEKKALLLGVYTTESNTYKFTEAATQFDKQVGGKLTQLVNELGGPIPLGTSQVYHNLGTDFFSVALSGLGSEDASYNKFENLDQAKENTRIAAGVGARSLQAGGADHIMVEAFNGQTEAAAEGSCLGVWLFQDTKNKDDHKVVPTLDLWEDDDKGGWQRGINKAEAQNIARRLSDMPSNLMTPALFAQAAADYLCPCGIQVNIRDKEYIEEHKMSAFLAVAKGSCEMPLLLELMYSGGSQEDKPIVLVGKGVTHDCGGLCLKNCKEMLEHKGDLSGSAAIVGTMRAIAALNLPLNVTGVIPLCENMPSGMAVKPGDVVFAANGRSIKVENSDIEGPLVLADAFIYSMSKFKPRIVVDIATLTRGMREALGSGATGAFVTNDKLWDELKKAGAYTGDRVWRFPFWDIYTNKITKTRNADMTNVGIGPGASSCRAAAFLRESQLGYENCCINLESELDIPECPRLTARLLYPSCDIMDKVQYCRKEFIPCGDWIHLDTNGSGMLHYPADVPYMKEGRMSGRPTRTLIQFLQQIVNLEK